MSANEFPWYNAGLKGYSDRTKLSDNIGQNIVENAADIGLARCQSCISIGVGTGDADIPLLRESLPNLKNYTVLEPNERNLGDFKRRLSDLKRDELKVTYVPYRVEDWPGPPAPVDLILVVEVLYHIPDRQELFTRCLQWLAPGGTMVVANGSDDHCFVSIAQKYDVEDQLYTHMDVRKDFDAIGIKSYSESKVTVDFDIRDRDPDIMNFLMQKQLTTDEFNGLDEFLKECMPEGHEDHTAWTFWVKKDQ